MLIDGSQSLFLFVLHLLAAWLGWQATLLLFNCFPGKLTAISCLS